MRFYYKFDCISLLAIEFYIRLNLMRMKTIERISFENNGNMSRLLIVYDVWIAAAAAATAVSPPSPLPDFLFKLKQHEQFLCWRAQEYEFKTDSGG